MKNSRCGFGVYFSLFGLTVSDGEARRLRTTKSNLNGRIVRTLRMYYYSTCTRTFIPVHLHSTELTIYELSTTLASVNECTCTRITIQKGNMTIRGPMYACHVYSETHICAIPLPRIIYSLC